MFGLCRTIKNKVFGLVYAANVRHTSQYLRRLVLVMKLSKYAVRRAGGKTGSKAQRFPVKSKLPQRRGRSQIVTGQQFVFQNSRYYLRL
jgi:hypothetical protein